MFEVERYLFPISLSHTPTNIGGFPIHTCTIIQTFNIIHRSISTPKRLKSIAKKFILKKKFCICCLIRSYCICTCCSLKTIGVDIIRPINLGTRCNRVFNTIFVHHVSKRVTLCSRAIGGYI